MRHGKGRTILVPGHWDIPFLVSVTMSRRHHAVKPSQVSAWRKDWMNLSALLAAAFSSFAELSEHSPFSSFAGSQWKLCLLLSHFNLQPHQTKAYLESLWLGSRGGNAPPSVYNSNGYLMSLLTCVGAAARGNKGF